MNTLKPIYRLVSLKPAAAGSTAKYVAVLDFSLAGNTMRMTVPFGHRAYRHNYSDAARRNYLRRSAGICNKDGDQTKDNPSSANYWSRRVLWDSREPWLHLQNPEQAQALATAEAWQARHKQPDNR
jgi:hypothetical protein